MSEKIDVKKIAGLARLSVEQGELESLANDLEAIFDHVEQLRAVDVESVEALSHVHGVSNIFRADKKRDFLNKEQIIKNLPDSSGSFIRVPLIVEQVE